MKTAVYNLLYDAAQAAFQSAVAGAEAQLPREAAEFHAAWEAADQEAPYVETGSEFERAWCTAREMRTRAVEALNDSIHESPLAD